MRSVVASHGPGSILGVMQYAMQSYYKAFRFYRSSVFNILIVIHGPGSNPRGKMRCGWYQQATPMSDARAGF
ncbi:hypothetical protein F511_06987 [Dorcoceras hygrometricum]|uniref:Uncharacterized protein n=1 Tax=Dorcoceras hygrometricum TaxID=472368 RepID=A0A2Z7AWF4_9LAMI|nr:hypothetical protein F511_06987 [Dorcoceras hygrometricum]